MKPNTLKRTISQSLTNDKENADQEKLTIPSEQSKGIHWRGSDARPGEFGKASARCHQQTFFGGKLPDGIEFRLPQHELTGSRV